MIDTTPVNPTAVDGLVSRVITDSTDLQKYTFIRETDSRTALARGLKEYLEGQQMDIGHGRQMAFKRFLLCWGEPEIPAEYPSAVLTGIGPGEYEAAGFTPRLIRLEDDASPEGQARYVKESTTLTQQFLLEVWTTDKQQRTGLTALMEDALEPALFMSGLRLELPYYFGARATYLKSNVDYDDNAEDAHSRWRRSLISITGSVQQIVPVGDLVNLRPRTAVELSS